MATLETLLATVTHRRRWGSGMIMTPSKRSTATSRPGTGVGTVDLVPRHPGDHRRHRTQVADAGKNQAGADESGKPDESRVNEETQDRTEQGQGPGRDLNLSVQRECFLAANDRQAGFFPSRRAAADVD